MSDRFPRTHWAHHDDLTVMDVVVTILRVEPNFTEALAIMVGATDSEIAETLSILERDGHVYREDRDYGDGRPVHWWHLAPAPKLTP